MDAYYYSIFILSNSFPLYRFCFAVSRIFVDTFALGRHERAPAEFSILPSPRHLAKPALALMIGIPYGPPFLLRKLPCCEITQQLLFLLHYSFTAVFAQRQLSAGVDFQLSGGIKQADGNLSRLCLLTAAVNMHGLRPGTDHKIFDHIHTHRLD